MLARYLQSAHIRADDDASSRDWLNQTPNRRPQPVALTLSAEAKDGNLSHGLGLGLGHAKMCSELLCEMCAPLCQAPLVGFFFLSSPFRCTVPTFATAFRGGIWETSRDWDPRRWVYLHKNRDKKKRMLSGLGVSHGLNINMGLNVGLGLGHFPARHHPPALAPYFPFPRLRALVKSCVKILRAVH